MAQVFSNGKSIAISNLGNTDTNKYPAELAIRTNNLPAKLVGDIPDFDKRFEPKTLETEMVQTKN